MDTRRDRHRLGENTVHYHIIRKNTMKEMAVAARKANT